jgi:endonuclease-3
MSELPAAVIALTVYPVGFYRRKSEQIREICRLLLERHDGKVPDRIDELLTLPGVGRKTANLVVTLGFGKPGICVDTHVHRITNRMGWVRTRNPEETERELRRILPRRHWIPINEILVRHGQRVCKPISPVCSACLVSADCPRRGVTHRR